MFQKISRPIIETANMQLVSIKIPLIYYIDIFIQQLSIIKNLIRLLESISVPHKDNHRLKCLSYDYPPGAMYILYSL